jgi:hypothetical protein
MGQPEFILMQSKRVGASPLLSQRSYVRLGGSLPGPPADSNSGYGMISKTVPQAVPQPPEPPP